MKQRISLGTVRDEAFDTIQKLKSGQIDVKTAGEIRNLLDTIIDTGKTEVEMFKALPESVKEDMYEYKVAKNNGTKQLSESASPDDETEDGNEDFFVRVF